MHTLSLAQVLAGGLAASTAVASLQLGSTSSLSRRSVTALLVLAAPAFAGPVLESRGRRHAAAKALGLRQDAGTDANLDDIDPVADAASFDASEETYVPDKRKRQDSTTDANLDDIDPVADAASFDASEETYVPDKRKRQDSTTDANLDDIDPVADAASFDASGETYVEKREPHHAGALTGANANAKEAKAKAGLAGNKAAGGNGGNGFAAAAAAAAKALGLGK